MELVQDVDVNIVAPAVDITVDEGFDEDTATIVDQKAMLKETTGIQEGEKKAKELHLSWASTMQLLTTIQLPPPGPGEPREKTLTNGTDTKWFSLCNLWDNHYRAGYPADAGTPSENIAIEMIDGNLTDGGDAEVLADHATGQTDSAAVAYLRNAGIMF